MDELPHNKLLPRTDGPFHKISARQHTLTIDKNGAPSKLSLDQATRAPLINNNVSAREERNTSAGEGVTIEIEDQAPENEVAEGERCDTEDRTTNPSPAASKKLDAPKPHKASDSDVCDKNDKLSKLKQIGA